MNKRSLSKANVLWISSLGAIFAWHVGFSFAEGPLEILNVVATDTVQPSNTAEASPANTDVTPVVAAIHETPASRSSDSLVRPSSFVATIAPQVGSNWATTIGDAKTRLLADLLPDPTSAKSQVEASANSLQQFLSTAQDERFGNWLAFLRWNELQELLRQPEPNIESLIQIERNMRQNYVGLEYPQFVRLRESLTSYISALRFGQDDAGTLELIDKRLDQLAETLQTPASGADATRQREIGLIASILTQANQLPDIVQSVRGEFGRPNLRVLVSNDFVQRQFGRSVNEPAPVREIILGTSIFGQSYLQGYVNPLLLDNSIQASLRLLMNAQMSSNSVGYNRGVKIYSRGSSHVTASETISLTDQGLVSSQDTSVTAPLRTTITGIDHRLRIVEKIASKKAAQQKPLADSIARGRLETRVATQFHSQLEQRLSEANANLRDRSNTMFSRLGLLKPRRTSWSSGSYLSILWKQQGSDQLAAPASCPIPVSHQGITIQVHQSAIINVVDPIIGGRLIRNTDLDDLARQFGREPSADALKEAAGEPWSIEMAGYHPIEVEFDDQLIKFRIRTTKLDRGDQTLDQPATIEAAYKFVIDDGGVQLERQGDVSIEFVGRAQRGLRAVTLRSFLKTKFESVFKQKMLDEPFRLTDRLPADFPTMNVVDIQSDEGWLQALLM